MRPSAGRPRAALLCLGAALASAATRCAPGSPLTVDHLRGLDVAFVGVFKCGSSSFRKFFEGHPDVAVFSNPHHHASERARLEADRPERPPGEAPLRVLVAETFVQSPALMACLLHASPRVRLLLLVREPVSWFESLYNFVVYILLSGIDRVYFLPPFSEVLKGKPFGNSRWDVTSPFLYEQLTRTVLTLLPPHWHSIGMRLTPSTSGFNTSSPLLVIDLNSFREPQGAQVVATLEKFMGLKNPFPPHAAAVLTDPKHGQNMAGARVPGRLVRWDRSSNPGVRRPRYVDLCSPRMADNLTQLVIFYARERARLRALLLSPIGSGVPSLSLERPAESLCQYRKTSTSAA